MPRSSGLSAWRYNSDMRTVLSALLLFAVTVGAQPDRYEAILTRLNRHLLPLKSMAASQGAAQEEIMRRYADEMSKLYQTTVIPRDLSRSLTAALAGKDLTNENLMPLTRSIVAALNLAFDCRESRQCELGKLEGFRSSALGTYNALLALGAGPPQARTVMNEVLRAGLLIRKRQDPVFRNIPPGVPPKLPSQLN